MKRRGWFTIHRSLLILAGLLFFSGHAPAQTVQTTQDRADALRGPVPFGGPPAGPSTAMDEAGEAVASPNDADLGEQQILQRAEKYQPFTAALSTPFFYTSNVALVNEGEEGDIVFAPIGGVSFDPRFTKTFFGHFAVRHQYFAYDEFDELDFSSLDVEGGITYYMPAVRNLILRALYNYTRLADDDFDEILNSHSLILNLELPVPINRAQQLSVGTDMELGLETGPDEPQRHDFNIYAGYFVQLSRKFTLSAAMRLAAREYVNVDRLDVAGSLAVTANYQFNKWLGASAMSSVAKNTSSQHIFEYDVANIGGALSVTVKF